MDYPANGANLRKVSMVLLGAWLAVNCNLTTLATATPTAGVNPPRKLDRCT